MPAAPLTAEQQRALVTRDTSVALSAGAGCGKTLVLTERFLAHLQPGDDDAPDAARLHQLIAITFTEAAAREMRRRIRNTCYDRLLHANSPRDRQYWLGLMRAIESARVSTIHSFCRSLLQTHAVAAGVDPGFGVLEQGQADVLVSQAIDDVLRERLSALDADTMKLAAAVGLSKLKTQLLELLAFRHERAFTKWQEETPEAVLAKWRKFLDDVAYPARLKMLRAHRSVRRIEQILAGGETPTDNPAFQQAREALQTLLPRLAKGDLLREELEQLRDAAMVQGITRKQDWPSAEAFEAYKTECAALRGEIDKCLKLKFDADAARKPAELGLIALRLAADVAAEYERRKAQEARLDFEDLLAHALRLCSQPENRELQQRMSKDLQLLLVDEFQDTNQLQVDLVKAICGDGFNRGKLFFVGDFKQSIYRFRGAQPQVFHDLRQTVDKAGQLGLRENFRSQPGILHFVNALFCETFGEQYEPLHAKREQATPEPVVEFLWTIVPGKNNPKGVGARAARAQEADTIARRLRELLDGAAPIVVDDDKDNDANANPRPLNKGDVAILFRTLSDVATYERALRDHGLDYYLVGGHAFYSQQEIYDVLNLLRAVASPADEIALAGALRSPFFSLADETLFWLVESGGTLNDGLFAERLPAALSPVERQKAAAAAATLAELRAQKDRLGVAPLLKLALALTGFDAAQLADFLGERKLANLEKLIEQARAADAGSLDLAGFIAQLAEFIVREPKEALAATLPEEADVVRLMTIHQAKGLEFPLVIVADLDRRENQQGPPAALDSELGPVIALNDDDNPDGTTGMDLYRIRERQEDAEERKRLLYVATTRAADYLILSSSLAGTEPQHLRGDWTALLAERFDLASGEPRAALPPKYPAPQIRVTQIEGAEAERGNGAHGPDIVGRLVAARNLAAERVDYDSRGVLPIPVDEAARRRFSVSRLSGRLDREDAAPAAAVAESEVQVVAKLDALAFGRLVHAALEKLDFRAPPPLGPWCEQLADALVLPEAARAATAASELLARFVASPRRQQLAAADAVHREVEFLLAWPPDAAADGRYLQGYIDCLYHDAAGWHLVDYKTNNIAAADVPRVAADYEMQMLVYALAAERALGEPPVELALHFLRPGVEHAFTWNDAARRRCLELVDAALAAEAVSSTDDP